MKIYMPTRFQIISTCIVGAGVLILSLGLISWAGSSGRGTYTISQNDSIPSKQKKGFEKDLDKELQQLENAKKQLQEFRSKDWDKMEKDLEQAMKNIDIEKIRVETRKALSELDMEKLSREIEASLNKIDFDKIERDIESAMDGISKIDKEKIQEEMTKVRAELDEQLKKQDWRKEMEEIKKIDMKEINAALEQAKKEIAKVKDEINGDKIDIKETMIKAHSGIDKAKEDLKAYQEMIYSMEQEGLLDTKKDYTIQFRDGEISINGKKQSKQITDKYKKYFRNEQMTIKKQEGKIDIDSD